MSNFRFTLTSLDYQSLVREARRYAALHLPNWDFDNEADIGRFALDIYLRACAQNIEIHNGWAQEAFITSARQRASIIAHAAAKGYSPRSAGPATGKVSVHVIPSPTTRNYSQFVFKFSTRNLEQLSPIFFENAESFSIPPNATLVELEVVAGETLVESFTGTGLPDQVAFLTFTPVIDGSLEIIDDLDNTYTQVQDFVDSAADDKHFIATLQPTGETKLLFGDDSNAQSIQSGRTLSMNYRVGGGLDTNVQPDSVKTVEIQPLNIQITTVNNVKKMVGGRNAESDESIKKNAVSHNRQRDILAKVDEVREFAESYSGVSRAFAQLLANAVFVSIIPEGGGSASSSLKTSLQADLNEDLVMGYTAQVDDAQLKVLTAAEAISVQFTTKEGYDSQETANLVTQDLLHFIDPTATKTENGRTYFLRRFGEPVRLNDIRARLQAFANAGAIENDYTIVYPTTDVAVTTSSIATNVGSEVTATSRNIRIVTYKM